MSTLPRGGGSLPLKSWVCKTHTPWKALTHVAEQYLQARHPSLNLLLIPLMDSAKAYSCLQIKKPKLAGATALSPTLPLCGLELNTEPLWVGLTGLTYKMNAYSHSPHSPSLSAPHSCPEAFHSCLGEPGVPAPPDTYGCLPRSSSPWPPAPTLFSRGPSYIGNK